MNNYNINSFKNRVEFKFNSKNLIGEILSELPNLKVSRRPSYVNTLYFDTVDLKNYFSSIDGEQPRKQFRYRFYTPYPNHKKIKKGFFHIKYSTEFGDFKKKIDIKYKDIIRYLDFFENKKHKKVSLIQYKRFYFISDFSRVTLDTNLSSYSFINDRLSSPKNWPTNILEIKVPFKLKNYFLSNYLFSRNEWRLSKYEISLSNYESLNQDLRI